MFEAGDADYDFYVVLAGEVAIVDQLDDQQRTFAIHRKGEFAGDLALLTGEIAFATAVVRADGEVLRVPSPRLREIVEQDPGLSDLVLHALLLRRSRLISDGGGVEIIGSSASPETQRLRRFVRRNGVPHAVRGSFWPASVSAAEHELQPSRPGREPAPASLETSLAAVLAAGDVRAGSIARVASAVGEGAAAARIVRERLIPTAPRAGHGADGLARGE